MTGLLGVETVEHLLRMPLHLFISESQFPDPRLQLAFSGHTEASVRMPA